MTAGRPTRYNKVYDQLIQNLKDGATIRDACRSVGISEDTFAAWKKKYPEFADSVEQAEAGVAIVCTRSVIRAAEGGDWRAALEYLKRRRREWGDSITVRADQEATSLLASLFPGSEGEDSQPFEE